jgi:hypothetical protein
LRPPSMLSSHQIASGVICNYYPAPDGPGRSVVNARNTGVHRNENRPSSGKNPTSTNSRFRGNW